MAVLPNNFSGNQQNDLTACLCVRLTMLMVEHALLDGCIPHAGAKLDMELMKRSKTAGPVSFSRAMVLRRLHGHVDPLQNFQYRMHLLQVCLSESCFLLTLYCASKPQEVQ